MTVKKYADLFEDEISELLRSMEHNQTIEYGTHEYKRSGMIAEDGIYTNGSGYFTEYFNGHRSGTVNAGYLVTALFHKEFTIYTF